MLDRAANHVALTEDFRRLLDGQLLPGQPLTPDQILGPRLTDVEVLQEECPRWGLLMGVQGDLAPLACS